MFDFAALYDEMIADAPDGAIFIEIGCLAGRSTCYLGSKIRESGKSITVYAIDTCLGSPSDSTGQSIVPKLGGSLAGILHHNLVGCNLTAVVVPILTESVRAARLFQDASVHFCFVDADHSYESVLSDLKAWWPKIRPGGVLAGHDYRDPSPWLTSVTDAVHDFFHRTEAGHPTCRACWHVVKSNEDE